MTAEHNVETELNVELIKIYTNKIRRLIKTDRLARKQRKGIWSERDSEHYCHFKGKS